MTTIQYLTPPPAAVTRFGDPFGRVFLDVDASFEVRLTKALDAIDEREQVSQEAALSGDLPATGKNRALLEQFRPDAVNRNRGYIPVEVIQDGERLPLTGATVTGYQNNVFEVELFGASWLDDLEALVLADVDLGTFEYTKAEAINAWNDRQSLAIPGVAHYGAWRTPGNVTLQDLRFWFNLGKLLRECFCAVGWAFESPHFDTGEGAYLFTYLPNTDEFWYEGKQSPRYAATNVATPQGFTGMQFGNTLILDDVYDPGNLYNNPSWPGQYKYDTSFEDVVTFRIKFTDFTVELPPSPDGEPAYYFTLTITKVRNNVPFTAHIERYIGSADQTRTVVINFEYIDYDLVGGDGYIIRTNYRNLGQDGGSYQSYTILSGDVEFQPNPATFYPGDFVPLNNLLPSTVTAKDLLEAAAHLINGKLYTDYAAKKVTLYAPWDYEMQDEETIIEGFFIPNKATDLRAKTLTAETGWKNEDRDRDRFLVYKFADSTDPYIDSDKQYSRRVDLGTGVNKETKIENPLFEPTGEVKADTAEVGGSGVWLPVLWDNEDGDLSTELGPRICNFYGFVGQSGMTWSFEGITEILVPYLAMIPTIALPVTVDFVALTYNGFARDLYNLFYRREVENCRAGVPYSLLLTGGDDTYRAIDFRHTVLIRDEDSDLEMQPTAVRDHVAGSRVPLLVEARIV